MKRLIASVMFLFSLVPLSESTEPNEYVTCMEYISTNYPNARPPLDYGLQLDEKGLNILWNLPTPKPTFAQLDAIKTQALAWKSNQVAEAAANISGMDIQLKSVIRALVKVVNDRLPSGQKITEAELTAAIKAEAGK